MTATACSKQRPPPRLPRTCCCCRCCCFDSVVASRCAGHHTELLLQSAPLRSQIHAARVSSSHIPLPNLHQLSCCCHLCVTVLVAVAAASTAAPPKSAPAAGSAAAAGGCGMHPPRRQLLHPHSVFFLHTCPSPPHTRHAHKPCMTTSLLPSTHAHRLTEQ